MRTHFLPMRCNDFLKKSFLRPWIICILGPCIQKSEVGKNSEVSCQVVEEFCAITLDYANTTADVTYTIISHHLPIFENQ